MREESEFCGMLTEQTAIELAEVLGYQPAVGIGYYGWYELPDRAYINPEIYFTFERMALLALEYELTVALNDENLTAMSEFGLFRTVDHNGSLENKQRAYCQAVAKVLIEVLNGKSG